MNETNITELVNVIPIPEYSFFEVVITFCICIALIGIFLDYKLDGAE